MKHWLAVVTVMLATFSICHCANLDMPISDDRQLGPRRSIMEGVQGRVTDTMGHPVVGALITPTSLDTPSQAIPDIAIVTDQEGHYAWRLLPGNYMIAVFANGYVRAAQPVTVKAHETAQLDFVLEPAS